ncbi:aldehyde dehydrogenase family protein [Amycolatopsis benzoatilytica]|uniref:aldehyde dehydrogenase family protein n=1 Tax=Amycolatopsis benzoatilytica TaxID=346045 RepID=UPI00146B9316|nr:aldehyde dehydrogenase family protein [Amycolatopsis benzoatilytica]
MGAEVDLHVTDQDEEISPARIAAGCRNLAGVLRARGVSEEDRVVLSAGNSADFVLALFALLELGVSVALADRRTPQAELAELVGDSGARWFLSDHDQLDAAFDRVRVGWLPLGELAAAARAQGEPAEAGEISFERWAARTDALVVWSSGSSGRPKGIVRSGASVLRNVAATSDRMGYTGADVLMPLLPFTHQYGLSMLLLWWQAGATLTLVSSRRIDQALETIARRGVTVVDAVPAAYDTMLRILAGRREAVAGLASVRMWCVGGEPLRDELRARFEELMNSPLLDGYGSSEAGNIALASAANPVHCGRPLDEVRVEVLGPDGNPVPAGEVGEVVVHTPDLMTGVLEPGGRVRPVERTVHRSGDVGFLDEAGNLRVLGRKSAVHRFGYTIYPDALADKLSACGAPVRIVPVADERRGAQLVCLVADPADQSATHWRRVIGQLLADHERPNRVVVLREFPVNNNGKVDLRALQDIAESAVALDGVKGVLPVGRGGGASGNLSAIPFPDRVAKLTELTELLRTRREEVLQLLTEVSTYKTAYGEIDASIAALSGAVAEVTEHTPPAVEQIGVLMPSNIPLYSYILYLVIPSLYSRRVVFRPSRRISDQTRKLHELLSGTHGLPIVLDDGDQAEFLEGEGGRSDVLVFTGTYKNAEKIRLGLRREQLFLYFGQGVNPFIVGADADLPKAVDGLLRVRMLNSGQDCFGPDVVFVHTSVSAQFCNLLCRRVNGLRHGRYDDPSAEYGSMFYLDAFDASVEYLRKNREFLAAGGEVNFVEDHLRPTVLIRPADTKVTPPELFAPIFNVVPFTSQEWLHTMVDHPYFEERAMAASVFGTMPETVELLRRRHTVSVNETLIEVEDGNAPFGGTGIRANYAAIGKKRYAQPLLVSKAVADHLSVADTSAGRTA